MNKKILIIAAHPDDEIFGCGGTAGRLAQRDFDIFTLILGEGITSRDERRNREGREGEIKKLQRQMQKANKIIGIRELFFCDFPDNRFDTVPLLDMIKAIESVIKKVKPDIIFTHFEKDLNIDHQICYKAVLSAIRPVGKNVVKEVYSFEIPSSTEWSYPLTFSPDVFFDISKTIDRKLQAMKLYAGELRRHPHPRSVKGIRLFAARWGMSVGTRYAEAFKCVRIIK